MEKDFGILRLFDLYKGLLTQKQREAVSLYYERDLSLGEIGENLGISRQAVKNSIDKAVRALREADKKLELSFFKAELIRALENEHERKEIIENLIKIL